MHISCCWLFFNKSEEKTQTVLFLTLRIPSQGILKSLHNEVHLHAEVVLSPANAKSGEQTRLCNKQEEQKEIEPDHIYQLCSRINRVKSREINHVCPLQRGHMKPGRRSPKSSNYDSKKMVAWRGQAEGESQGNQTPTVGALLVYLD